MRFKNEQDERDFTFYSGQPPNPEYLPFHRLRNVLAAIDELSIASGHGEIMITSFIRKDGRKSYHSKGQAADIRIHTKHPHWIEAMMMLKFVLWRLDPQIQMVTHLELLNSDSEHLHIEIDDHSL